MLCFWALLPYSPTPTVDRQWTQPAVSLSPSNCPWKVDKSGKVWRLGWVGRAAGGLDLGCGWEPTPPGLVSRFLTAVVRVGVVCICKGIISVDRMDGNVSSSNYTKESDLFHNTKATAGRN